MNERPIDSSIKQTETTQMPGSELSMNSPSVRVLDHGFVRLVDHMGSDLSVVRSARQSYDAAWRAGENEGSDAKLIHYLWDHKHTTPFEAVTFTFEVHAPIFVFRQWHRHRTWSYNELSARYTELADEFYVPAPDLVGYQSKNNKQGRSVEQRPEIDTELGMYEQSCKLSFETYKGLLAAGWPRELARSVLPVSTYSNMFATVDLLNLLKFLTLRTDSHAQYEIRVYANAMLELIRPIVPICIQAWAGAPVGLMTPAALNHPGPVMTVGLMTPAAPERPKGMTPPDPRRFDFSDRYQDGLHYLEYTREGIRWLLVPASEGLAIIDRKVARGDCSHLPLLPLKANTVEWNSLGSCYRWMYDSKGYGYRLRDRFHEHWGKL